MKSSNFSSGFEKLWGGGQGVFGTGKRGGAEPGKNDRLHLVRPLISLNGILGDGN